MGDEVVGVIRRTEAKSDPANGTAGAELVGEEEALDEGGSSEDDALRLVVGVEEEVEAAAGGGGVYFVEDDDVEALGGLHVGP